MTDCREHEWARGWMAREFGDRLRIETMVPVPSRLARLHRVTLIGADGRRRSAYLKQYARDVAGDWAERLRNMQAAAAALQDAGHLLPFTILAADETQGVLLTAEVPGQPLTHLHRPSILSPAARRTATAAWHGVGRWLSRLHGHARPPALSEWRGGEVAGEILVRLDRWEFVDPRRRELIGRTRAAVQSALARLGDRPAAVVLCHGDVTPGNIVVHGADVGLLDLDDVRPDMPGLDLSQARLAIEEFGHLGWPVGARRPRTTAWLRAFAAGYARPLPVGPEMWLPHLRNLVVYLLTLASGRSGADPRRIATELRYRRLLRELDHTLTDVQRGRTSWPPGS